MTTLVLDTGVLGMVIHPNRAAYRPVADWLTALTCDDLATLRPAIPEIADYELRRKLLHLIARGQALPQSLHRLEQLNTTLDYLPIDTATMRLAAELWAESRQQGTPTAPPEALDGDVILAAQALQIGGIVVTQNRKHLDQFVPTATWQELQ
jgi:predicted nucleic acid-binding protein